MSTNGGGTWFSNQFPAAELFKLACSVDGNRLVGVCYPGGIYTSTNLGATWVSNNAPNLSWICVACSADGDKMIGAAAYGDGLYACQLAPSTVLNGLASEGNFQLSWTVPSMDLQLQQSSDLTLSNWSTLTAIPALNYTNVEYQLSMPIQPGGAFFRLRSP